MIGLPYFSHPLSPRAALWRREAHATTSLAVPLALTNLAYMAIGTTDVVMMGWLGPESLAAGTLAVYFYGFFYFFCLGVLGSVAPILAQHIGARRFRMVRPTVRQGLWLSLLLAVPSIPIIWHAPSVLVLLGQDPDLVKAGEPYLRTMVIGFVPGLWLLVFGEFLAAHARPRAVLVVMVLGIFVNGLADYTLIFGNFGFPRLGLVGAGVASATVTTFMFLSLLGFVLIDRRLRRYRLLGRLWRADWAQLYEIVRVGVPIAVTELAEMSMFFGATLIMGLLGPVALAAHAIAGQCCGIVFMVPLGLGQAASVRVGRAAGAGDHQAIARAGWTAMGLGVVFAFVPALAFWFFGTTIASLFFDADQAGSAEAIALAVSFLSIAAVFQFADAIQVVAMGALRGLKDTRGPMLIALAGYWGVGLTSAAVIGVYFEVGGEAVWTSLAVALFVVSVLLVRRFHVQSCRVSDAAERAML